MNLSLSLSLSLFPSSQVLLELNFLPLCVCLSLGSSYGAYYLIPLLSFNFLFTVAFVAIWPSIYSIKQNRK